MKEKGEGRNSTWGENWIRCAKGEGTKEERGYTDITFKSNNRLLTHLFCIFHKGAGVDHNGVRVRVVSCHFKTAALQVPKEHLACGGG